MALPDSPFKALIPNEPQQIFITSGEKEIARLDVKYEDLPLTEEEWQQRIAIANLLVSAPSMLKALRKAEQDIESPSTRALIRRAIEKAEGRY
jgi:hypothetical protein